MRPPSDLLTVADVQRIVDESTQGLLTAEDVRKLVFTGEELTADDVQKIVDASIAGQLTIEDVRKIISEAQITLADLKQNTDAAMMGQVESSQ